MFLAFMSRNTFQANLLLSQWPAESYNKFHWRLTHRHTPLTLCCVYCLHCCTGTASASVATLRHPVYIESNFLQVTSGKFRISQDWLRKKSKIDQKFPRLKICNQQKIGYEIRWNLNLVLLQIYTSWGFICFALNGIPHNWMQCCRPLLLFCSRSAHLR